MELSLINDVSPTSKDTKPHRHHHHNVGRSSLKGRERTIVNQTLKQWNRFKGKVGEASVGEAGWSAA